MKMKMLLAGLAISSAACWGMDYDYAKAPLQAYSSEKKHDHAFHIDYLSVPRSFYTVKENAFAYMSEINAGLDFKNMHYFEAKMRELQANGPAYLREIRAHIQAILKKYPVHSYRVIMLKHVSILDTILAEPGIRQIEHYLAIKTLLKDGEIDKAIASIEQYHTQYGDCESARALEAYVTPLKKGWPENALVRTADSYMRSLSPLGDRKIGVETPDAFHDQPLSGCAASHTGDMKIGVECNSDQQKKTPYSYVKPEGQLYHTHQSEMLASKGPLSLRINITNKNSGYSSGHVRSNHNGLTPSDRLYYRYHDMYERGDIQSLCRELKQVTHRLNRAWFTWLMLYEKRQVATLKRLLSDPTMQYLSQIKSGASDDAKQAFISIQKTFNEETAQREAGLAVTVTEAQLEAARELFAQRADCTGFIGRPRGISSGCLAECTQQKGLYDSAQQASKAIQHDVSSQEKARLFGLDTASDFSTIGGTILEQCDLMLTTLHAQSPQDFNALKNEITQEVARAKAAQSIEQFSYHLGMADAKLTIAKHFEACHTVQSYDNAAQLLSEKLERSAELLGRTIVSFAQRTKTIITHPHHELYHRVMAPIHLAKLGLSLGKIAKRYGSAFISSHDKWQFVCQSWSALVESCNHITAEEFVDGLGVLAADIVTQRGLGKVCSYLTKLESAVETVGKGKRILQKIESGFDRVLQKNPLPIPPSVKKPAEAIVAELKANGIRVPEVTKTSINTVRALKETPLYYVMRRTYRDIRKYGHAYENKFKGFGPFANQYVKFPWKHIFCPDFKRVKKDYLARLTGWHHDYKDIIEKSGLIEFVSNKKEIQNGFCKATIRWSGRKLDKTFFPSHLKVQDVMRMIGEAYQDFLDKGAVFQAKKYGYIAVGVSQGVEIEMFFSFQGILKTCYPALE